MLKNMVCPRKKSEEMIKHLSNLRNKYNNAPIQVKTSIIYMLCSVLRKGISFFAVPIYTRLVSEEQYGVYTLYQSWELLLIVFATLNMWNYLFNNGMVKYENRRDEFSSALTGLNLLITVGVGIVLFILRDMFAQYSGLSIYLLLIMFVEFLFRPSYEYWCARQRFEYDIKKCYYDCFSLSDNSNYKYYMPMCYNERLYRLFGSCISNMQGG